MIKIRLVIVGLLTCLISIYLFTGCTIEKERKFHRQTEPVELTMWVNELFSPEGEYYEKRIDEFNKAYRGKIHVTLIGIPRPGYEIQVEAASKSGQLPDIIAVDGPVVAYSAESGTIIPMDEYVDKDFLADFLPSIIEQGTYKDKLYQLGFQESSVGLFYNIRLLKQAGVQVPTKIEEAWTWEELLQNAKKLTKPTVYGLNMYTNYYINEWFPYAFLPLVWSNGGDIVAPDGYTVEGYLNGPKTVEAFDFISRVFKEGVSNTGIKNTDFQNQKVAMVFEHAGFASDLKRNYSNLEWGIMPYPVSPNTKKQVTPSGSWGYSITSNSKHPKEAFEVIKWMTNTESNLELYQVNGMPPARESVFQQIPEYQVLPERIIKDQLITTARPRSKTPIYPVLSENFAQAFKAVEAGEDPQKVLNDAVKNVERVIKSSK